MKTSIWIIGILIVGLTVSLKWACDERTNKLRHQRNEEQLLGEKSEWITESGKHVLEAQQLMLRNSDLEKSQGQMLSQIEELRIRNRRIESLLQAGTSTAGTVKTIIRDSLIYVPVADTTKRVSVFDWRDAWTSIQGAIDGNDVELRYRSSDTLTFVAHRVPRKFLFFRCGTKEIRLDVVSANPNTNLEYSRSVQLLNP